MIIIFYFWIILLQLLSKNSAKKNKTLCTSPVESKIRKFFISFSTCNVLEAQKLLFSIYFLSIIMNTFKAKKITNIFKFKITNIFTSKETNIFTSKKYLHFLNIFLSASMAVFGFCCPPESGEKITLEITILVIRIFLFNFSNFEKFGSYH